MRKTAPFMLLCACLALSAGAQDADARLWGAGSDAAKVCAPCLDDYLIVPEWSPRCGSSRGVTAEEMRKKLATEYTLRDNGKSEKHASAPDDDEVRAADALRTLEPGDYGWLHTVEVVKVVGDNEMLVKNLTLVDAKSAEADLKAFTAKISDKAEQQLAAVKKDYGLRIDKLEADKKKWDAWRSYGKSVSEGKTSGNTQGDPVRAKIEEIAKQIKELERQEATAKSDLSNNKKEILDAAKERAQARRDADKVQKKFRKEFGQTFRLVGFSTAKLRAGDSYAGPKGNGLQLAVAWGGKTGEKVLASVDLLQKPVDAAGLKMLLAKRMVTPADFLAQMTAAKKGKNGDAAALAARRGMADLMRK